METYTLTFGDCAENHVGMQKLGKMSLEGFDRDDLIRARDIFRARGAEAEVYSLNIVGSDSDPTLLVVKNGLACIANPDEVMAEQKSLPKDSKALMYGRVVNKIARHNLCFAAEDQEPDYENGKGRVVSWEKVKHLNHIRESLPEFFGLKSQDLLCEGNYYFNDKCGIGFHGDAERRIVIGLRLGAKMPLHYQWFHRGNPVGSRMEFVFGHGDFYAMSEKTTGNDWRKKSILTLRHAAGAQKYLTVKDFPYETVQLVSL